MLRFLKTNSDVFVRKSRYMPRIDLRIITHRLNVDPKDKLVKHKKRKFSREENEMIKAQVVTLKETKIVREVDCPTWLSNVVLVKKAYGSPHIYVSFIDINDACSKDCFFVAKY